jgi:hypothetical protein
MEVMHVDKECSATETGNRQCARAGRVEAYVEVVGVQSGRDRDVFSPADAQEC